MRKFNYRLIVLTLLLLSLLMLMTGCMPGDGSYTPNDPAGFLSGIWHGWIAPISLIVSLFSDNIHLYEPINTGFWYEFGFYIAIISGFGGLSLSRRRRKNKD
ncbi:hypothetical protein [Vallitalea okinawensis]|uniref:hypothetical protein n=1 Tax=Vallitalea okinawensis TaxID=2078660 RepID=UPI000CFB3790|nr:hypothetical protein [Vallitalea okinawensis]